MWRRQRRSAAPGSSSPITPKAETRAPSAPRFAATFPAPPRHSLCSTKSTTGTAASGESRVAVPHKYRSSIKSPSTPIRRPLRRGSKRFRRGNDSAIGFGISNNVLFVRDGGFFDQHDGNVVAHRIHSAACGTLQTALVIEQLHWHFA